MVSIYHNSFFFLLTFHLGLRQLSCLTPSRANLCFKAVPVIYDTLEKLNLARPTIINGYSLIHSLWAHITNISETLLDVSGESWVMSIS